MRATSPIDLPDLLDRAGLTGRGGGAFRTAVKVRAATEHHADLVVNACDGELGAAKDAYVVAEHLAELAEGASLVGARTVRYAVHRDSGSGATLRAAGLDVLDVPRRYVSSEESSLVSLAHGGLARPLTKHVPVVFGASDAKGRAMRPTVVLNAETVLRIAQIARHGTGWFRSFGTDDEPGPRLATVGGAVAGPGVLETQAGVPVTALLAAAGGTTAEVTGVAVGGLGGGWLTPAEAAGAMWSSAGLAAYGLSVGPGVVHVLGDERCPLVHLSAMLDHAAGESAGQCGPCMFGVPAVADDVRALASGRVDGSTMPRLRGRLGLLPGRGACRFPDGVAGLVRSALRAFAPEVALHEAGRCSSHHTARRTDVVTV